MKRGDLLFPLICNIAVLIITFTLLFSGIDLSVQFFRGLSQALLALCALSVGSIIRLLIHSKKTDQ